MDEQKTPTEVHIIYDGSGILPQILGVYADALFASREFRRMRHPRRRHLVLTSRDVDMTVAKPNESKVG